MDIVNIEALISEGRILTTANIDPANDYALVGKWQRGNRKFKGDGNAYKLYVVPLSELIGGGGYSIIQEEGVALPQRTIMDFVGPAVTVTDNGSKTIVTINAITGPNLGGTLNYLIKFTPDGFTGGDSQIYDNGTNIGIGTAIPLAKLHVVGTSAAPVDLAFFVENISGSKSLLFNNDGRLIVNFPNSLNPIFGHTFAAVNDIIGDRAFNVGNSTLGNDYLTLYNGGAFAIGNLAGPVSGLYGNGSNSFEFNGGIKNQMVGINTTPTAQLHTGPSSGAANNAPIKLEKGTMLASLETGVIEMNDALYFTTDNSVRFGIGGTLFDHFIDATTAAAVETDLYSDSILGDTLSINGDKLEASYLLEGTSGSSIIRSRFAGTVIFDSTVFTSGTVNTLNIIIIRVDAATIRVSAAMMYTDASIPASYCDSQYTLVGGLTLSNPNILKLTGEQTVGGSTTAKLGTVKFFPAAL